MTEDKKAWKLAQRAKLAKLAHELSDAIHSYNMARPDNEPDETTYVNMAYSIADHFTHADLWGEDNG